MQLLYIIKTKGDYIENQQTGLKERILEEMTVDYSNTLEKNFDLAKQFVRITKEGKVDVKVKDRVRGKDQILLYLIGKLYAKEASLSPIDDVGNQELIDELGIPIGSVLPWLKELRDERKIKQIKRGNNTYHSMYSNWVEKTLKDIEERLK